MKKYGEDEVDKVYKLKSDELRKLLNEDEEPKETSEE